MKILLGELKEFRNETRKRLDNIEKKVDGLEKFKIKLITIAVILLGSIELAFKIYANTK